MPATSSVASSVSVSSGSAWSSRTQPKPQTDRAGAQGPPPFSCRHSPLSAEGPPLLPAPVLPYHSGSMLPEPVRRFIQWAADEALWGPLHVGGYRFPSVLAILLFGSGLYLTIRYRFVQLTRFREAALTLIPPQAAGAKGALSPFQAFMTALAASIGTGNIAGVATAVVSGGP